MTSWNPSLAARLCLGLTVLLFLVGASFTPIQAAAQTGEANSPQPGVDFVAGEVLVQFRSGAVQAEAVSALASIGAAPERVLSGGLEVWSAGEGRELEVVERMQALPSVEHAQPNYYYRMAGEPNDPEYFRQWAYEKTGAEAAWDLSTGGPEVIIAVLDTGIDETHPEFSGKLISPADFIQSDTDNVPHDENAHGTHVAGIAAGQGDNGLGITGVSWQARIMPVQVLDGTGSGTTESVSQGIAWAYLNGAKVINLSLSGEFQDSFMQQAINDAYNREVLVVAAAGNEGTSALRYPAAMNHVLAVGATDRFDRLAYYSNTGSHIDVVAPGGDMRTNLAGGIFSTTPTYITQQMSEDFTWPDYDFFQGTSMAAPYVSGLAALIYSLEPGLNPDEVEQIIKQSAFDLGSPGKDAVFGYGRVDVLKTLQTVIGRMLTLLAIENSEKDGSYLVDWTDIDGATTYELQEDDNPSFSSPSQRYSGAETQLQVDEQPTGVWYYRVRARVNGQFGGWSSVQTTSVLPPAPDLNAIVNPEQMDAYRIQWESVSGVLGYTLEQSSSPDFSAAVVRYQGEELKYDVTGQAGGVWYYRVRSYNLAGNSPWSVVVQTEVLPSAFEAPRWENQEDGQVEVILASGNGNRRYELVWQAVSGAAEYILEVSENPYFVAPEVAYQGDQSVLEVKDQAPGVYYYRVRAAGPEGMSPWSITARVDVRDMLYLPLLRR